VTKVTKKGQAERLSLYLVKELRKCTVPSPENPNKYEGFAMSLIISHIKFNVLMVKNMVSDNEL